MSLLNIHAHEGSISDFEVQGFRLRRVAFFAGTKKVTKEMPLMESKTHQWIACRGDFPTRHPGSVGKRRASMHAALRVFGLSELFAASKNR